jgi:hypothetical protein
LLPVERDVGEAFFEVRSVENVTDKEEATEDIRSQSMTSRSNCSTKN